MKAADDQVTRRKGTKAIPLKKHSIAPPGVRGALRGRAPGCSWLRRGAGAATCRPARRQPPRAQPRAAGRGLRDGGGRGPAPEGGEARAAQEGARGEAAGRGRWGPGGPGLLRNE